MQQIILNFTSPQWWITVILVSIVLNWAMRFTKRYLDRTVETRKQRRREKLQQLAEAEARRITALRDSNLHLVRSYLEVLYTQNYYIFYGSIFILACLGFLSLSVLIVYEAVTEFPSVYVRLFFAIPLLISLAGAFYYLEVRGQRAMQDKNIIDRALEEEVREKT